MSGINKAILLGRLGKNPERKSTRDGKVFATFSIATSKKIRDEEKTTWHNVIVWNENTAKYCLSYAVKGSVVYVEGEIDNRTYDKPDGSTGYASEIIVSAYNGTVQIVANGKSREERPQPPADDGKSFSESLDDEIPF